MHIENREEVLCEFVISIDEKQVLAVGFNDTSVPGITWPSVRAVDQRKTLVPTLVISENFGRLIRTSVVNSNDLEINTG